MTKYTAHHLDRDDPRDWVVDTDGARGEVWCNSEAEAKIIAWALNAVAAGRTLAAFDADEGGHWMNNKYDGPTEGVAS